MFFFFLQVLKSGYWPAGSWSWPVGLCLALGVLLQCLPWGPAGEKWIGATGCTHPHLRSATQKRLPSHIAGFSPLNTLLGLYFCSIEIISILPPYLGTHSHMVIRIKERSLMTATTCGQNSVRLMSPTSTLNHSQMQAREQGREPKPPMIFHSLFHLCISAVKTCMDSS